MTREGQEIAEPLADGSENETLTLLDGALAVEHQPDTDVFVGDGHYACEPMVAGLDIRGLVLVSKLRRDTALWVSWIGPPRSTAPASAARGRAGGRGQAAVPRTTALHKPFQKLLRVVFVLDADADPAVEAKPTTLFVTDQEMAPERIYRDRFQIEFNFRDTKQHLGLAACQVCTAARHHFHVNAVLATRLGPGSNCATPARAPWTAFRWSTSSSNRSWK